MNYLSKTVDGQELMGLGIMYQLNSLANQLKEIVNITVTKRKHLVCSLILILLSGFNTIFSQEVTIKSTNLKVIKYIIDANIDFSTEKLLVHCKLTIKNSSDPSENKLPVLLYRLLKVKNVTDLKGRPLSFDQKVTSFVDWPQLQVNYIEIQLPQYLIKNAETTVIIDYDGYILGYSEIMKYVEDRIDKKFTILRDDCFAIPKIGIPSYDFNRVLGMVPSFDYELNITVPDEYVVANIGELVKITQKDSQLTYHYKNKKLAWRIDIIIAQYHVFENRNENLKVYYFPEDSIGANKVFQVVQKIKEFYSSVYGKIKYDVGFTIIEVPSIYGSQADGTGLIFQAKNFDKASDMRGLYHEMSHLWDPPELGDDQPRLNEGLATFHEFLLREKLENKESMLLSAFARYLNETRETFQENSDYAYIPLSEYGKKRITQLSYTKGMLFFTVFYYLVGEEEFFRILHSFHRKYIHQGASLNDFADHIKHSSKFNMTKCIQEWIFDTKSSKYILDQLSLDTIVNIYKNNMDDQ
jgi:hypothetical protein